MTELTITASKTAIEALVNKVKSAVKEEAELWQIVQRDLVFINDEFEMIESFLNAADRDWVKNSVMRTWVRQVWDLSYHLEDCAELVYHLDTKPVVEIKLLKARVEEVSQRNMRYNLNGNSGSGPVVQMQQTSAANTRTFDVLDTIKKHSSFLDLTKLIAKEGNDLQVISVCGAGGDLGTTSIIRKAYDNARINKDFKCCAWVKLVYPFNHHDFIWNLLAQFYTNYSCQQEQGGAMNAHPLSRMEASSSDLVKEFVNLVDTQRYLIILEDLSSMAQWDTIMSYLPDKKNGSRIVVSTQQLEIASLCMGKPYQVSELTQFSADHSVWVFFKEESREHTKGFRRDEVVYRNRPSFAQDAINNYFLVGRDTEMKELDKLIGLPLDSSQGKSNVVPVCGDDGVGKSSLVRTVYNHYVANNRGMFNMFVWVNVSHPFNLMDFSQSLLLDMHLEPPYSGRIYRDAFQAEYDAIKLCKEVLKERQCLVVVAGLQSKNDWDTINNELVSAGTYANCIIVITTEESVATHCAASSGRVCNVKPLDAAVALDLFRKVFPFGSSLNENMIEQAKPLLSKCDGVPKRIIALASYLGPLANRPRETQERERKRLNDNFKHEVTMAKCDSFLSIFTSISSSFDACPHLLKKCIFYLSIFPENKMIRKRHLVRRWIAEGYSKGIGSCSLENDAEKLFNKIAELGMIQQAQQPITETDVIRKVSWQVNCLILEYIISWQTEEKVLLPLEVSVLEGKCSLTTGRVGQHLAIRKCWGGDEFMFNSMDFSRLRSLTVFENWKPFFISEKMRVLRVLDLEGTPNIKNGDLDQIGDMIPRLKFLSLRRCTPISQLPDSMGELRQLQTLDIRYTKIITLPKSIINLRKLQYIRAGETTPGPEEMNEEPYRPRRTRILHTLLSYSPKSSRRGSPTCHGIKAPKGIGRLTNLHTLGVVYANIAGGESILRELSYLTQLRKLIVSGINGNNSWGLFNISWHALTNLTSLSMGLTKGSDKHLLQFLELPEKLQRLKLYGHVAKLPKHIGRLDNLTKLTLQMTTLFTMEDIQELGKLKRLHTLRLRFVVTDNDNSGEIKFCAKVDGSSTRVSSTAPAFFDELNTLEIACRSSIHVSFLDQMIKLEQLKVDCSYGLSLDFTGLEHLISLNQVVLKGSPSDGCDCDAFKEALKQKLAQHPKQPPLKQEQKFRPGQ
ncbi:hypothetical protein PVAP13_8KG373201 [Panicum virgatum]|uniref:Uncharacterized protein n=1 Tax=Panicum virgatum TaxID=38727 RepID=A0A8T0PMB3_PANVG|nr:hypothetical protein PVAP13_8KG373201 [Panicum virgatum]